ncbi:MAG TPA: type II toxin-antitoxin system HicB family antitoxin [Thermomicrobiales bacterium]|jgi:predicted RNase H-like HicB family nuclease
MDIPRYSMVIQWSDEDHAYLVSLPEWEGRVSNPVTHGDTYEEAAKNGLDAMTALSEWTVKEGRALPSPQYLKVVA